MEPCTRRTRSRGAALAAWSLALVLPACHGGGPTSFPAPPMLELGTGADHFVAIADGDAVPIIMGLQGGFHVWGSARARYLDPRQIHLVFTLTADGHDAPDTIRHDHVDLSGTSDGLEFGEHLGSAVFLPDPGAVRNHSCHFHLEATDQEGRSATVDRVIEPT